MRPIRRLAVLLILALATSALAASALATSALAIESPAIREITPDERATLLDGGTLRELERGRPARAEVVGLIEAPVDELAAILVDYPHVPDWAPASRDFEILEHSGDEYVISGVTAIPWPISDRHWHMRSVSGWESVDGRDVFVYRFQYIPGTGNIEDSNGYWLLMPMPDEPDVTYVRYVVHADPGLAIPNVIIRWVTRSALPDLIDGLRERHHELH